MGDGVVNDFGETSIGLDRMALVLNGSQRLVKRSIGNEPSVRSNPSSEYRIVCSYIVYLVYILCSFLAK